MPDFEDFYKYKISNHKTIIFFSSFVIFLFWNITKIFPYFGCLNLSDEPCSTAYLYFPPNTYLPIGKLELYVLFGVLLMLANVLYTYFKHKRYSWIMLTVLGIILLFLKYLVTNTTLY